MSRPLLSICIPTFNRAGYLTECLASIQAEGLCDDIEVVVSDNASTDDTQAVLTHFKDHLPLRWVIQAANLGADRNFDAVVNFARGKFCWILGSDDCIEPDGLRTVLDLVRSGDMDILHFGYIQADIALRRLYECLPQSKPGVVKSGNLACYLETLPNVSMLFAFISSFVFRRRIWTDRQAQIPSWFDTHYVHLFVMHAALADNSRLMPLPKALVIARGDNPNEFNTAPGKFLALDSRTLDLLSREIYGNACEMRNAIGSVFRRSYTKRSLIYIAANGGLRYIQESRTALLNLGISPSLIHSLLTLGRLQLLNAVKVGIKIRKLVKQKTN